MKTSFLRAGLMLGLIAAPFVLTESARAADADKAAKADIYDESADGSKQIADALVLARKDGKRVLLQFGANWCIWCRRLHSLYETDSSIAAALRANYVVVMIDVNGGRNRAVDSKYGHPTRFGIPAIVILDAAGKQLTTKNSGELEKGDHHSPAKVLAFLKQWSPQKS